MSFTDDLKKKDDKKVWESYLGSRQKDKLILEPIPEYLDILNTNLYDIKDDIKDDNNISIKKKEELFNGKEDVFKKDNLNIDAKYKI